MWDIPGTDGKGFVEPSQSGKGCVIMFPPFLRFLLFPLEVELEMFNSRNLLLNNHCSFLRKDAASFSRLGLEPNECLMKEEGIKDKVPHHFFFCPTTTSPGPVHESHYARLWLKFPLTCAG